MLPFSFYFFLEMIRTIGQPYQHFIYKLLVHYKIRPPMTPSSSSNSRMTIHAMDEYIAKLILQGQERRLLLPPPKYMPSIQSFLGIVSISLFYVFGIILFPTWFLTYHIWLFYHPIPISSCNTNTTRNHISITSSDMYNKLRMKLRKVHHQYQQEIILYG